MGEVNYEQKYIGSINDILSTTICDIDGVDVGLSRIMSELVNLVDKTRKTGGRIFFVGNGASAAFSNHMALDWSKNGNINAYCLSDSTLLTALANDYSYESAFSEYLKIQKCNSKDIVVIVSSSGNSPNIVNTLGFCKTNSISTIGFSGLKVDNSTRSLANYSLYVAGKTYGIVECSHQVLLHLWLDKFMNIYEWDRDSIQNMNSDEFNL